MGTLGLMSRTLASCIVPSSLEGVTDPCPLTEKYLEAHYLCHSPLQGPYTTESTTMTSSTGPPLPPWLTTRPPVSFFPGLRDLDIRPRVPFTLAEDTTKVPSTSTPSPAETLATETERVVTVTDVVLEEKEEEI